MEKWSFYQGLSREVSRLSLTHKNTLFYTFSDQIRSSQSSNSTKKVRKLYFWTNFKTFNHFYPLLLPIFGLSFKFYYGPLSGHYRSYIIQNFVFKTYAYPKLSRKNLGGGGVDLLLTVYSLLIINSKRLEFPVDGACFSYIVNYFLFHLLGKFPFQYFKVLGPFLMGQNQIQTPTLLESNIAWAPH